MSEWHDEFRAYARAFGKDEVAAILLRSDDDEWLVWPKQTVEGLTFTLTADEILNVVDADDLQHVVGWVHSHPMGIDPCPSGTDDDQIRTLATDMGGQVCEMWIFGGHDYELYSTTKALIVGDEVFISDTHTWRRPVPVTQWDEQARSLYEASKPKPVQSVQRYGFAMPSYAQRADPYWEDDASDDLRGGQPCPLCSEHKSSHDGELCDECDDKMSMGAFSYLM